MLYSIKTAYLSPEQFFCWKMASPDRPVHQSRRVPSERRVSNLVRNPSQNSAFKVRTFGALRIDLPGAFNVPCDNRFVAGVRSFPPDGRGTRLIPIERKKGKKPRR